MGEKNKVKQCLDEAKGLSNDGHHSAALIYLVQAAEMAAKEFLQRRRGIRVPYFLACIPHLREAGLLGEGEEVELRRMNTMRNLAIHSGLSISGNDYKIAKERILKLIKKLK